MASWCLATAQAPETFLRLTQVERQAFVDILNRK